MLYFDLDMTLDLDNKLINHGSVRSEVPLIITKVIARQQTD